jgi:hypothetical protein
MLCTVVVGDQQLWYCGVGVSLLLMTPLRLDCKDITAKGWMLVCRLVEKAGAARPSSVTNLTWILAAATCCCLMLLGPHLERRGQPAGEQGVQDATSGQLRLSCTVELAV